MRLLGILLLAVVAGCQPADVAGQPAPDYYPMNKRELKLNITYDAAKKPNIRQTQLFVSRDQGQTWAYESFITPDKNFFAFIAREDGLYWFQMVTVFTDGSKDPSDPTKGEEPQKILVDATPPVVRLTTAERQGDEIAVEWSIEEKYPHEAKTRLSYRELGGTDADWKDVPLTMPGKRGTRFNPNSSAAVQVRVTAEDLVGNAHAATRDVGGVNAVVVEVAKPAFLAPAAPIGDLVIVPPMLETMPAPVINLATADAPKTISPEFKAAPLAAGSGTTSTPPPAMPAPTLSPVVAEPPPAQLINFTSIELPVLLEAGPSGVKSIDVYITRDDGRNWTRWSTHDGRDTSLKVNLRPRMDVAADGVYGFKLVATSGAGLSEEAPRAGTAPEFRVQVDTTPPYVIIGEPVADPTNRDVLILLWSVTDRNLGTEPVALEWSDSPAGPWKSVAAPAAVAQVAASPGDATTARIPNTGKFAWKVPTLMNSSGVYLRLTAWDGAGNRTEVATSKPIPVDMVKPRARIQGVVQAAAGK